MRACYHAHRYERSLKKQAIETGVAYGYAALARSERRLTIRPDRLVIDAKRRCAACERKRCTIVKGSKICEACKADGWVWCWKGQHATRNGPHLRSHSCVECARKVWKVENFLKRGVEIDPPPGYVPLAVVAKRLHWCQRTLTKWIGRGWMAGAVWRRCPTGRWWIEDRDVYPSWEGL